MQELVGRINEIQKLESIYNSNRSEFLVVYGRRRVGKTFLIRSVFRDRFTFQVSGLANANLQQQITNFYLALQKSFPRQEFKPKQDWLVAFSQLATMLEKQNGRKLIFIDELPWFDTRGSKFIQALEHFWNSWASARDDIVLIACGSATSWMINKLINNRGGLHNRVSQQIKLLPFQLSECETYLKSRNIQLDRYQIIQLYMSFGGVPYYWDEIKKGESAAQNIDRICFSKDGLLRDEFHNLYRSLFNNYDKHLRIIKALAKRNKGLDRLEIIQLTGLPNAGSTTRLLDELELSGFIRKYTPFGRKKRNSLYQLQDFYTLFYIKFIDNQNNTDQNSWINLIDAPKHRAWSGYAYELICMTHLPEIKKALGIEAVQTEVSSWKSRNQENGTQIDLIIDRRDQTINLIETKFSISPFTISGKYAEELRNKIGAFKEESKTRKSVFLSMITTFGLKQNEYSGGLVQSQLTMDDLFEKIR